MRAIIRWTILGVLFASTLAHGDEGIYPEGATPKAKKVNGRWVPVDEDDPTTQDKSENALELLQMIHEGKSALQTDVTDWEPPMPQTVAQAIWALRYKQNARHVAFDNANVVDFGLDKPTTVDQALRALALKDTPADKVLLEGINVIHYGLDTPKTVEDALAILVRRVYELEARVAALEAP